MYIAEISPAKIRGTLVSCNQFAIIFGMLVVYFVNYLIRNQLGDTGEAIQAAMVSVGWRRMFLSEAFPAATFLLLILFVPETPRYLTLTGRDQKALQVLTRINGAAEARTIHTEIRRTVHAKTERLFAYGAAASCSRFSSRPSASTSCSTTPRASSPEWARRATLRCSRPW